MLGVNGFGGGDAQVEDEQGHGNGEDAVAEGGDAFDALACNAVVEGWHPTEFIGCFGEVKGIKHRGHRGSQGKGRGVGGEWVRGMRYWAAGQRACGAAVMMCLLLAGRGLVWAQGGEPAQNSCSKSSAEFGAIAGERTSECARREPEER